jgi:hypothetical protein
VGANLELRSSRLIAPGRYRHHSADKPSLDIGGVRIGRDLICAQGVRNFAAHGEVRARGAQIGRTTNFSGSLLGNKPDGNALYALGMQTLELVLTPFKPPQ